MRIKLDELKKAIAWMEANSRDVVVTVYTGEARRISLKCMDKYDSEVEITLFEDEMMPKIKKTEFLK